MIAISRDGSAREHFSVDIIDGVPARELRCDRRKLVSTYLRVGFDADGAWRTFGLRKDFQPSVKIASEDDITVSAVTPVEALHSFNTEYENLCVNFVANCDTGCSSDQTTPSIAVTIN